MYDTSDTTSTTSPAIHGIHHIAVLTRDLDAFVDFYTDVLGAELRLDIVDDGLRHAFVAVGNGAFLHAFEMPHNRHAAGAGAFCDRGHLDHFAFDVATPEAFEELRRRLVARGATDGTVTDFGAVQVLTFADPDGHDVEIAIWTGGAMRAFADRLHVAYQPDAVTAA